jgi:hypothetical protein
MFSLSLSFRQLINLSLSDNTTDAGREIPSDGKNICSIGLYFNKSSINATLRHHLDPFYELFGRKFVELNVPLILNATLLPYFSIITLLTTVKEKRSSFSKFS